MSLFWLDKLKTEVVSIFWRRARVGINRQTAESELKYFFIIIYFGLFYYVSCVSDARWPITCLRVSDSDSSTLKALSLSRARALVHSLLSITARADPRRTDNNKKTKWNERWGGGGGGWEDIRMPRGWERTVGRYALVFSFGSGGVVLSVCVCVFNNEFSVC